TVDWISQSVDHTTQKFGANRYLENASGTFAVLTLGDRFVITQNNRANRIALKVQGDAKDVTLEFDHFTVHNVGQTVNSNNTVSDRDHSAFVAVFDRNVQLFYTLFDNFTNF